MLSGSELACSSTQTWISEIKAPNTLVTHLGTNKTLWKMFIPAALLDQRLIFSQAIKMLKPMAPYQVIILIYYHPAEYPSARMGFYYVIQGKQGIPSEKERHLWIPATGTSFHLVIPAAWNQAAFICIKQVFKVISWGSFMDSPLSHSRPFPPSPCP